MIRTLALWAVLLAAVPAFADDPVKEPPPGLAPIDAVRLPEIAAPQPTTVVTAGTQIKLTTDVNVYVFDADVEVIATTSPPGLLNIAKLDGPLRLRDVFADNPSGRKTLRTFKGKFVFEVTAKAGASGTAELLVLPSGAKGEVELRRRVFEVNGGGPAPPRPGQVTAVLTANPKDLPGPGQTTLSWKTTNAASVTLNGTPVAVSGSSVVDVVRPTAFTLTATGADGTSVSSVATVNVAQLPIPPPPPTDPSPFPGDANRILIVYENMTPLPPAQESVIFGQAMRDYIAAHVTKRPEDNQPEARIYDQNVKGLERETPIWRNAMARPRKSVPWLLVGNARGQGYEGPLPATEAETLTLLKKYLGD